jgi:hypothetical protein
MTVNLGTTIATADQLQGTTEAVLAALWREVLQTSELPNVTDDFFALGGTSMTLVMLEYRIAEEFSVDLPAGVVLGAPTLRALSALVDAERQASRKDRSSSEVSSDVP